MRYRGLEANANNRCPPSGDKAPFMALVSEKWARSTGNLDVHMLKNPDEYTILSLDIPSLDIDSEYFGYLADTEFDDGDDTSDPNGNNGGDENQGETGVGDIDGNSG